MKTLKILRQVMIYTIFLVFSTGSFAAEIDWRKITTLKDAAFLKYVESLDLKGQAALDFWKKIPLSRANKQVNQIFRKDAFKIYMNKYPRSGKNTVSFKVGMGTVITGPMSQQKLKLPFTHLYPLKEGPIGNSEKIYKVGYAIHALNHPWQSKNVDAALWEANRHPNIKLTILDAEFDNKKQVQQIDTWIAEKYDGIMIWPLQEAPTGPPVERAFARGIPSVSIDRMVGTKKVNARITGNFPANGTQQGMYLIHRLLQEKGKVEGNILMIRKPLGSTADAMRTGNFLRVISYFPGLKILGSFHNNSNRKASFEQVQAALKTHANVDVIFCTGAEQSMGAVQAVDSAGRWNSRGGNRRIIILNNDDPHEALDAIEAEKLAMTAPYTPLLGALGLRVLLKIITGENMDQDVTTPDLTMITKEKENVFGIETIEVKEWRPYSYGRKQ